MECHYIPFGETQSFSKNDVAYIDSDPKLREFYGYEPVISSFDQVIEKKKLHQVDRKTLVRTLKVQYSRFEPFEETDLNIDSLLSPDTFTITTAHQPSLFTGPLYFIYKIISAINLTEKLKIEYPQYHFVPIFWSGAEDHDFEEINHVKIFRDVLTWENNESGSVGQMSSKGILPLIEELKGILGKSENADRIISLLTTSFQKHDTYGKASLEFVNLLFGKKGLVLIDASHKAFKSLAIPLFKKEILERPSEELVKSTQLRISGKGFKTQAFARPINLFYLGNGFRERIDFINGKYIVLNQDLSFSEQGILSDLEQNPERYSPNVILRPLYQESLLPNLAYIGGGGEISYWLERKTQFEGFGIPYPMLIRRDSVLWIDSNSRKKISQLGISLESVWKSEYDLIETIVKKITNEEINLLDDKNKLVLIYHSIKEAAERIDPTLSKTAESEMKKAIKGIETLENKMVRAEKRKYEAETNKIKSLKNTLFPNNNLQERKDNFIPFYIRNGDTFFDILYQHLDVLDKRVKVILEA